MTITVILLINLNIIIAFFVNFYQIFFTTQKNCTHLFYHCNVNKYILPHISTKVSIKPIIMITFNQFNQKIQQQFSKMSQTGKLFRVNITGQEIWNTYLSSFEDDNVYRDPESSTHNCNTCQSFIRRYGNIVTINEDGQLESLFSNLTDLGEYRFSAEAINQLVTTASIKDVFLESYNTLNTKLNYESCKHNQRAYKLGVASNLKKYTQEEVEKFGVVNTSTVYEYHHFNLDLPKKFVDFSNQSLEQVLAQYRDKYAMFKRAMQEIPLDTLKLVRDLIKQNSLLDGTAHLHAIEAMIPYAEEKLNLNANQLDNWCWISSHDLTDQVAKFKNSLIGVLCTELAEGMELNKACNNWNKRVDPVNYHKAKAPITKLQIAEAQKFVQEHGYLESFNRRLATIDDIKASEIKHINVGDGTVQSVNIFDNVKATSTRHKRSEFDGIEEVTIDKFMKDILPSCNSVEAYLKNSHENHLVTMTTSNDKTSKPIFKWDNNYSWTFNGNLAGKSQIKEAVKTAGGAVDGVLRFSIMWAQNDDDNSDLDAHCKEPSGGSHIYYSDKISKKTKGTLDIDVTQPKDQMPQGAVENITYPSLEKMIDGTYKFYIHQYAARNSKGFRAEIEFDGEIYSYEYNQTVSGETPIADVTLKNGKFSIKHHMLESNASKEIWGLETNQFHKVNLVCLSPNHWNENNIGNLHYFFMLDKCKTKAAVRGFHNENLISELLKHRKVMEVLGSNNMIKPEGSQLAGLGFNSTVKDELIVKCSGSFKRMLKIKF